MKIKTPAKITPYLQVLSPRNDGFHEVNIALAPVSIFDELELRPAVRAGIGLEVTGSDAKGAPRENLVYRAALAFQDASGMELALELRLHKNIPSGAGLGGGSGNAAGTLLALNALHGNALDEEQLAELALDLGSDVPFFMRPTPSLARGRGEQLAALPEFPELALLVVKPPFEISTAQAYGMLKDPAADPVTPPMGSLDEVLSALENQFEQPLGTAYPELAEIKFRLLGAGAAGALLSGSGSALFGVFADAARRDSAADLLRGASDLTLFPCRTLRNHAYLPGS
ncbi:MAG: 4-(cytidine 5'-diphospho)-2-C-methyl-D-erythritol kinase [SAR324 cluster bacterium]|nr:4-(cytidine 5'-diphospho)-2-C-methyl-D-erythritol kinase [SAR324 cluster bacterium]MCZ6629414.1 4-(cytidine 5'-diphospho)-2-C-methyl-D-erythritol kinase [SAR324 cluster bacterium]MCZ6728705.1 4-(cytidine 5'-diphospho)-2-C-methyl-D-erythritol kinase [SAR324 cluster bacterium]